MGLFSNFFKKSDKPKLSSSEKKVLEQPVDLSLDDLFVSNFINKKGKFIYCTSYQEVFHALQNIFAENNWKEVTTFQEELEEIVAKIGIKTNKNIYSEKPFFTDCEHLISSNGTIMFSSHQIKDLRLGELNQNFIVFARASQLVHNTNEGLTGIKSNYTKLPSNICCVKNYNTKLVDENSLSFDSSSTKNLYLILLEDF